MRIDLPRSTVVILFLAGLGLLAQDRNHQKYVRPHVSSQTQSQGRAKLNLKMSGKPGVGPNVQVNAPQQAFPNGLLGRSETTIAASNSGKLLLAGFNDAQGFCGPPFGAPCTPENPPGLSGFSFSTDGGLTGLMAEPRTRHSRLQATCLLAATRGWTEVGLTMTPFITPISR